MRTQSNMNPTENVGNKTNTDNTNATNPSGWTIINALDFVLNQARDSQLSNAFWQKCDSALEFLTNKLDMTKIQVVVLAILIESGEAMSWRKLGKFLDCSRLSIMVYTEEIEELLKKRWIVRKASHEDTGYYDGFVLVKGVVTALRHNKPFVPEKIDGLQLQEFVEKATRYVARYLNSNEFDSEFSDVEEWLVQICEINQQLPLCKEVMRFKDTHTRSLMMMAVTDFAQYADTEDEGLTIQLIDRLYPEDYDADNLRRKLQDGTHRLIMQGLLEHKCDESIADADRYMLTRRVKEELLEGYIPDKPKSHISSRFSRMLTKCATIKEKHMFYNQDEQTQIDRLTSLLNKENFPSIQKRLEEKGLHKGFACLFYGAPGTGKTETVLQLARQTGRDIMQVDIAGLRDKFVGESEKNIASVFRRYKNVCGQCKLQPILFFNEADAIINKRIESIEHSVDKMDNAIQNILLQEIENLDGILIATTNLTGNLDNAFERRFLFKIEFQKPDVNTKAKLWRSMLGEGISESDAMFLASRYDFSGGQIENIARKRTIDYILSGQYASVDGIEEFCQKELLHKQSAHQRIIGFVK